jgi:phosphatidylglycerophosphate synthase
VTTDPFVFTYLGLVASVAAFLLIARAEWLWAAAAIALIGLFDVLDGALARASGTSTLFGGFVDSVTDRFTEMFVIAGLLVSGVEPLWCLIALFGSLMVSYERARAEALVPGIRMGGLGERAERLVVLAAGCALAPWASWAPEAAVAVLCALTAVTVAQRIMDAWRGCLDAEQQAR